MEFDMQDYLLPGLPENTYNLGMNQNVNLIGNAKIDDNDVFTYPSDLNIMDNPNDLFNIIDYHASYLAPKYKILSDYVKGRHHTIIDKHNNNAYSYDNRSIVNLPKKLVDSFNGYDTGNPIQINMNTDNQDINQNITDKINDWLNSNDYGDNFSELNRKACIYGRSYLYLYQDGNDFNITSCTPLDTIVVYDDTVAQKPMFAIRYGLSSDTHEYTGTLITKDGDYQFTPNDDNNEIELDLNDTKVRSYPKPLPALPVIEMVENNGRVSTFGDSINLIDSTNEILSQKNNDLHSLSQGYLVVKGVNLTEKQKRDISKRHLINLHRKRGGKINNDNSVDPSAEFIAPQINDDMQENTLNRNISLIYQTAQVVDLNDPNSSINSAKSGTALKQLYQDMKSKAKSKDAKFDKVLSQLFTIMFNLWNINNDYVSNLKFNHKLSDISDLTEASTAIKNFQGANVPLEYQFSLLPNVNDPVKMANNVKQQQKDDEQQNNQNVQDRINQSVQNMIKNGVPNNDNSTNS